MPGFSYVDESSIWRAETASRARALLCGQEYFRALRRALIAAERQVHVVAWELHTNVALLRGADREEARRDGWPVELGALLGALVRAKPDLHVYVNLWDYSLLFVTERQLFPRMLEPWREHARIHFVSDDTPPPFGSHHQKIVTVDDKLAFSGGMDVTRVRWDTVDHLPGDERRLNPDRTVRSPYHDTMLMMDGEAARACAELCRWRWRRARAEEIRPPGDGEGDPWPEGYAAELTDVPVAFARTVPRIAAQDDAAHEVRDTLLQTIARARRFLYVENQYFTSEAIAAALKARLAEDDAPEILMVMPYACPGIPQSASMDVARERLLEAIREADRHDRFRLCYAHPGGAPGRDPSRTAVTVHAKVLVADDRLLRIGSANLANRSMGLDTELDCIVEAGGRDNVEAAIRGFRHRSMGSLAGVEPGAIEEAERESGGLLATLDALQEGRGPTERRLAPLPDWIPEWLESYMPDMWLADPPEPMTSATEKTMRGLLSTLRWPSASQGERG